MQGGRLETEGLLRDHQIREIWAPPLAPPCDTRLLNLETILSLAINGRSVGCSDLDPCCLDVALDPSTTKSNQDAASKTSTLEIFPTADPDTVLSTVADPQTTRAILNPFEGLTPENMRLHNR